MSFCIQKKISEYLLISESFNIVTIDLQQLCLTFVAPNRLQICYYHVLQFYEFKRRYL
ncbi:hypothetical protein HZS_505, partial [Henneguya salminicola]